MALKPEFSVMGGLAVATLTYGIYSNALPSQADIRALPAGTQDITKAEKSAAWISAAMVAGVSLIARDPGIFLIGATAVIAMSVWTSHSNHTESIGGKYLSPGDAMAAGTQAAGPEMMETQPYTMFDQDEFAR